MVLNDDAISVVRYYLNARRIVLGSKYRAEVEWQLGVRLDNVSESDFLREAAWVIINSGFRESTARRRFNGVSLAFGDWETAQYIVHNEELCVECATAYFRNRAKIRSIAKVARTIHEDGFETFMGRVRDDPIKTLSSLPFIGPITVWHLAKNIGCNVAKPDRHLVTVARSFGYVSVQELCAQLAKASGDPVGVVDLIIWRYCSTLKGEPTCQRI